MRYFTRLGLLLPVAGILLAPLWPACSSPTPVDSVMDVDGGRGASAADAGEAGAGGEAGPCTPRNSFAAGVAPLAIFRNQVPSYSAGLPVAKDARTFFAPGDRGACSRGGASFLRLRARPAVLGASAAADSEVAFFCANQPGELAQAVAFSPAQSLVGLAFRDDRGYLMGTFIAPDDPDWGMPGPPVNTRKVGFFPKLEGGVDGLPADAWGATFDGDDMVVAGGYWQGFVARFSRGASGAVSAVGFLDRRVKNFTAIAPNKSGGTWVVGRGAGAGALVLGKVTPSNALDTSWGTGGLLDLGGSDVSQASLGVDGDGRIVVGYVTGKGDDVQLLRVLPDGNVDVAYGGAGGRVHVPLWNWYSFRFSIAVDDDGTGLVPGGSTHNYEPAFVRVDATGKIDAALGVVKPPGTSGGGISGSFAVRTPPSAGCPGETLIAIGRGGFLFN